MELITFALLFLFSSFFIVLAVWKQDYFWYIIAGTLFIIIGADLYNNGLINTMYGAYGVFDTSINETVFGIATEELSIMENNAYAGMICILIAAYLFLVPIYNVFVVWLEKTG